MAKLVGLAFTSPSVAVLGVDREKFRVHCFENAKATELASFLSEDDGTNRKRVLLVRNVHDLKKISDVDVTSIVLFEDPATMQEISGIKVLDVQGLAAQGWRKVRVSPEMLNAELDDDGTSTFTITERAINAQAELSGEITFRELVKALVKDLDMPDFIKQACTYVTGQMQKKTWSLSVRKPTLAAGVSVETLAELEKFMESTPQADRLWRAYYEHAEDGLDLEEAADKLDANFDDLKFIVEHIGVVKGNWMMKPGDYPLVPIKKRGRKPKT